MASRDTLSQTLTHLIDDALWDSPWHRLSEAVSDLTEADLDYRPVAGVTGHWGSDMARPARHGARAIYGHLIGATLEGADLLPPAGSDLSAEIEAFNWECGAAELAAAADAAHRQARDRAAALADGALWEPATDSGPLANFSNAEIIAQCFVLHPSWHLGQLALVPKFRRMGHGVAPTPAAPSRDETLPPRGDWPFHMPPTGSPKALLLELLRQAQMGCPWHAFERVADGLTVEEAEWSHHPDAGDEQALPVWIYARHVAACDVMYADMALGERHDDWDWVGQQVGGAPLRATEPLVVSRRGYEFLRERVEAASDDQLEGVHEMHHGHAMTGWQVVACMIQHRMWHGGQIA
ncbi:MAG TPA: hypothetical protein PLD23_17890, partial [Armatimonadota bacterium]|nr:hypothetical protein [Armatimonadota bacterium]